MKKVLLYLVFFCCAQAPVFGQVYPFRTYSIESGLSESVVRDIAQDQSGYIWMATGFGLNKFDGVQFQSYFEEQGLNNAKLYSLFIDSKNRVWVGSDAGVNYVHEDSVYSDPKLSQLRVSTIISIFEDSEGGLWFGTDGEGLWYYHEGRDPILYTPANGLGNNQIRDIIQTENGDIWFATRNGLTSLSNGNFRTYNIADGLPEYRLRDLEIDPQNPNVFWIATRNGLSRFENGVFTNYGKESGIRDERIYTLSFDEAGALWCGTEGGVSEFTGERFINYTTEQGLAGDIVFSSLKDREGNIWFGTMGGGASLFLGKYFENYDAENGLSNKLVTSFAQVGPDQIWIASYGGGLMKYDHGQFEYFHTEHGLPDDRVYHISVDSQKRMWIGMRDGLSFMQNGKLVNLPVEDFPFRAVRDVTEARDGSLWISTYDEGLIHRKDGRNIQYTLENGMPGNRVLSSVEAEDGTIWAATYSGVAALKGDEITSYSIQEGLPNGAVMSVIEDASGTIWVSTFGGIAWFDGVQFVDITDEDGLPGRVCYFIAQDKNGIFWVGTNEGVVRLDIEKFYSEDPDLHAQSIQIINQDQGLISNETNLGAVFEQDDGTYWFGTIDGISRFIPSEYRGNGVAPILKMKGVQAPGHSELNNYFELKHDQDFVQIDFLAINFTAPHQIVYQYRMSGIDPEWQETTERFARYPSLPPGDYTFNVHAHNSSGIWSEGMATVSFTVLPPFWMSWWFILLVLAGLGGIIYLFYRNYQYMQMVDIERMRVRIASDLHDDVGASLTEIALQSDFLQASNMNSDIRESLVQIGKQCRKIVTSLDDIVWSIDARNDTLGDFTDRMQDYILNVLEQRNFQVLYDFDELKMENKLPVPVKENLYLIFKEAVNNVAKYSNGDTVRISMKSSGHSFTFEIYDNGTSGRGSKKTGHGLRNMEMRAQRIGGNVDIEDSDGFKITVTGKLNKN